MKTTLCSAVMTSIEALLQVPGTQLQHIESTLRQLMTDLKIAGITPPAELDDLIKEAAIAHAEDMAYMNGVAYGDEEYFQTYDDMAEEYADSFFQYDEPKTQKDLYNMLRDKFSLPDDELPF